jgi:hypothetical protein
MFEPFPAEFVVAPFEAAPPAAPVTVNAPPEPAIDDVVPVVAPPAPKLTVNADPAPPCAVVAPELVPPAAPVNVKAPAVPPTEVAAANPVTGLPIVKFIAPEA